MPARRFFAILKSSRKIEADQRNLALVEQCDIAAIAICNGDYYDQMRKMYLARVTGGDWRPQNTVAMDYKDKKTAMVLAQICKQKAKLEGVR